MRAALRPMTKSIAPFALLATLACAVGDEQEKAIGQDAAAQIDREVALVNDAQITGHLTSFATALATKSDDRNREWRFRLVDSEDINAFALPGGFVYVNRGLVE